MVVAEALSKRFGTMVAVDGVSFRIAPGKIVAILGPNGAGKTTIIKMLTTALTPTSGRAWIDGHDPAREPLAARRVFGIVFQDSTLDGELTAYENLDLHATLYGLGWRERVPAIEWLMHFVDLWDRRAEFVKGFSGGMRRRLEIARALLHEPTILFLDEPTVSLDPQTRRGIWAYVRRLAVERRTTVIFTSHYMDEAERAADEILVIDRGRIVAHGSPAALKAQTRSDSLEQAFIALTGRAMRDDAALAPERMRLLKRERGG